MEDSLQCVIVFCGWDLVFLLSFTIMSVVHIDERKSDAESFRKIKRTFYALTYMDNINFTGDNSIEVALTYCDTFGISNPCKYDLQKFCMNFQ